MLIKMSSSFIMLHFWIHDFFLCKIFLFHFSKHYFVVSDEFVHILLSGMCGSADDWYNSNRRCRRLAQITCHVWKRNFRASLQVLWIWNGLLSRCGSGGIWGGAGLQCDNRTTYWVVIWTLCSNHLWKLTVLHCNYLGMYCSSTSNKSTSGERNDCISCFKIYFPKIQ